MLLALVIKAALALWKAMLCSFPLGIRGEIPERLSALLRPMSLRAHGNSSHFS